MLPYKRVHLRHNTPLLAIIEFTIMSWVEVCLVFSDCISADGSLWMSRNQCYYCDDGPLFHFAKTVIAQGLSQWITIAGVHPQQPPYSVYKEYY